MFLCSQSFFSSVFYSWTFVKPEERGNLFPAIEVPSQRDGTCCWQPQALTRLKDGPTLKKTSLDASTNMEARKLFHLIRRRSKLPWRFSFAHHSQMPGLSNNRHIASSDFVFLKYLTNSGHLYFLNNCECFSSFLSDISWQPKCFALDWSCLCQIQHFTHLHQSQRVDVALLYFAIFVA